MDNFIVRDTAPRKRRRPASAPILAAAIIACAAISRGSAQEIIAVLSSGSNAYTESLAGFEKEWGEGVPAVNLAREGSALPSGEGIVIAFGAKAAMLPYPEGLTLIYWAPGLDIKRFHRSRPTVNIRMDARPDILVPRLKEIQPALKTLRVFFVSRDYSGYVESMRRNSLSSGITVQADRLNRAEDLPGRLRAMETKPDAVLVLNDPLLINARTFRVLRTFSWSNGVPLYAPTAGLVEQGATASIGPAFGELGREAARTARKVLEGSPAGEEVYPEANEISVNLTAAAKTGIVFSGELLKKAKNIFP